MTDDPISPVEYLREFYDRPREVPHVDSTTGYVDLGPGSTSAQYEDGYVHFHASLSTGGRGNASVYLKLRPSEAMAVRDSLAAAIEKHAEDGS